MGTLLQIASCIPAFSSGGKGTLGPLLSASVSASKRETSTSSLSESTDIVSAAGTFSHLKRKCNALLRKM